MVDIQIFKDHIESANSIRSYYLKRIKVLSESTDSIYRGERHVSPVTHGRYLSDDCVLSLDKDDTIFGWFSETNLLSNVVKLNDWIKTYNIKSNINLFELGAKALIQMIFAFFGSTKTFVPETVSFPISNELKDKIDSELNFIGWVNEAHQKTFKRYKEQFHAEYCKELKLLDQKTVKKLNDFFESNLIQCLAVAQPLSYKDSNIVIYTTYESAQEEIPSFNLGFAQITKSQNDFKIKNSSFFVRRNELLSLLNDTKEAARQLSSAIKEGTYIVKFPLGRGAESKVVSLYREVLRRASVGAVPVPTLKSNEYEKFWSYFYALDKKSDVPFEERLDNLVVYLETFMKAKIQLCDWTGQKTDWAELEKSFKRKAPTMDEVKALFEKTV